MLMLRMVFMMLRWLSGGAVLVERTDLKDNGCQSWDTFV